LFILKILPVKHFRVMLMPVMLLVWLWPAESGAQRPLILRVDQFLVIRSIERPGYRLEGAIATLAQPGDRLDTLGTGLQTGKGAIILDFDTAAGSLRLAPHSRLRITQIAGQADGSRWFYLTIEAGQAKLILAPASGRSTDPGKFRQLGAIRATTLALGWQG
jgi:hypothetical protein